MGLISRARDWPEIPDGTYRIERLLDRGGMGAVYAARDVTLDRAVAIKVIRPELVPDSVARDRFRREAQTLARLKHPSIVTVLDSGVQPDGGPYLVMELVRGVDLRRALDAEGRLDPARASRVLGAVCGAMESAHRDGVLHGDLKPENIMLPDDAEGEVEAKVLDFGVARLISGDTHMRFMGDGGVSGAAVSEPMVGTPAYMAPELLRGEPPDGRTDVFSLGVIAYEMLMGDLPFGGGSVAEVALAQARGLPPAIETLPAALSRAVHAALALDADRRPPTPQALAYLIGAATGAVGR
jgi:eukaryotic-like serine/threonine-protein kinase